MPGGRGDRHRADVDDGGAEHQWGVTQGDLGESPGQETLLNLAGTDLAREICAWADRQAGQLGAPFVRGAPRATTTPATTTTTTEVEVGIGKKS